MAEMIYNSTRWIPLGGEGMTGQYRFEPNGYMCFSRFMNDKLVLAMYVNQLVTLQLLNRLDELEQLHILKTAVFPSLSNTLIESEAGKAEGVEYGAVDMTQKSTGRYRSDWWP